MDSLATCKAFAEALPDDVFTRVDEYGVTIDGSCSIQELAAAIRAAVIPLTDATDTLLPEQQP